MSKTGPEFVRALASLGVDSGSAPSSGWVTARCPLCPAGTTLSLKVNVTSGAFKCHRCGSSSKDGATLAEFLDSPRAPSVRVAAESPKASALDDDGVGRYHQVLMDSPGVVSDLERVRGWTRETVERLRLGWNGIHIVIPIRGLSGELVNARMYDPFRRARVKSYHYANPDGLRRTSVWLPFGMEPIEATGAVWWFEGEPDAILAAQMGFPAAVITGGAGTWTDEALSISEGRKNVVCYDMDAAGRNGGRLVKSRLTNTGRQAILLEFQVQPGDKDFTDAVLKESRTSGYFKTVAQKEWDRLSGSSAAADSEQAVDVKLGLGAPGELVRVTAHVFGANVVPALIPATLEATCHAGWNERCDRCPVSAANLRLRVSVPGTGKPVLTMLSSTDRGQEMEARRTAGIPLKCPEVRLEVVDMWQVQLLKLIPPLSDRQAGDSTVRTSAFVAPADGRAMPVQPNRSYEFTGNIVPDPKTSEWTLVSADCRPAGGGVESFKMSPEAEAEVAAEFQPPSWSAEDLWDSVFGEARRLSRHVTKIYGRDSLLVALDLVYHSVIQFKFDGRTLTRGWLSLGVVGDTRTGKSETMHRMASHFGLGAYVMDPSNTTYAGLVGGLQQVGTSDKSWMVTWGLIPVNDMGLVVVDEVSSLSVEDIGKMSGMRSSGVAEITKIRSATTAARTRLVMAGNPRGVGASLASYSSPIEAFSELIGAPEDVARFDIALAVVGGLDKEAAGATLGDQPEPAPVALRRDLVKFAWSRSPDQISWEDGAERLAVQLGRDMVKKYDRSVPLVEPSEQDVRLARVATAAAVRTFSCSDGGVLVRRGHVEFAHRFMESLYDGDLGFGEYSRLRDRFKMSEGAAAAALRDAGSDTRIVCRVLMSMRVVSSASVSASLAMDGSEARLFIARLIQCGAAKFDPRDPRGQALVWSPEFIQLMRSMEAADQPAVDLSSDPY